MTREDARKIAEKCEYLKGIELEDVDREDDMAFYFGYRSFTRMDLTKMEPVPIPGGYDVCIAVMKKTGEICPLPQ